MRTATRQLARSALPILFAFLCASEASAFQVWTTGTGAEIKWRSPSVIYFVNPAGGPAGTLQAVTASLQTWTDVSSSSLEFLFGGTSASASSQGRDGTNLILFQPLLSDSIAVTFTWYDTSTGEITDSDILLSTSYSWSASGAPGSMDVQNIVTHESGHMLSLEDLYGAGDSAKTMYGFASAGETKKRTLDPDDAAGISHLYPLQAGAVTVISPNGGESFEKGSSHDIAWSRSGDAGAFVNIDLLKGGAVNGIIASSTSNDGLFSWIVLPTQAAGADYRIRITSTSNGSITDVSNATFSIVATPPPPVTLTGLSISGPASVTEGSAAAYTATASWSNGSATQVTPVWSVFPATFAAIDAAGVLATLAVPSDQAVTVSATYTFGGVTQTASQPVTITDVAATLTGLAIAGPASVNETGSVQYAATASWSNGSATRVTPVWSVFPATFASISEGGVLSALPVPSDQSVTVSASYTFGGVTQTASQGVTIVDVPDADTDGVPDTEEMGPEGTDGNYDGNRDGIPDGQQDNVASLHTADGGHYVTLAATGTLSGVKAIAPPADVPPDVAFPYGIFSFAVDVQPPGAPAIMRILLDGISVDTYYKFGGEPGDPAPHWYQFLFDNLAQTGAEFTGPFEITLHLVDGGRGDDDLSANGTIVDQGGPGIVQIPPPSPPATGGGGGCAVAGGPQGGSFREIVGARGILILAFVLLVIRGRRRKRR